MNLKGFTGLLFLLPCVLAESLADADCPDTQKGYNPYNVGSLKHDSAVKGIARGEAINWAIPSKVASNRSTTIQRWITVQTSVQCTGLAAACSCSTGSQETSYQVILSVDLPACTQGPFPIIWFFHGFGGQLVLNSNSYDIYIAEAVANGYATIQYDVLQGTIPILVPDAVELTFPAQILNYLKKESLDPNSVFYHKFDFNAIATAGHSRGGKLAAAVFGDQLVPSFTAFLVDPVDCTCFGPCSSSCYPSAYETLAGKNLTYAVVGATVKGCCNPDQTSCSIGGFGCTGADYKDFFQYASSASKLYLDPAGHLQYGYVVIPVQKLGNVLCAYNPQRSDAEVQLQAARWMVQWVDSLLPPMAKAFKQYVPLCNSPDPHLKDLIKHLKGVSGGRPMMKTKEKIFRETQLMFLQQPGENSDAPQLPQFPLDPADLLSFKADKPKSKATEEESPKQEAAKESEQSPKAQVEEPKEAVAEDADLTAAVEAAATSPDLAKAIAELEEADSSLLNVAEIVAASPAAAEGDEAEAEAEADVEAPVEPASKASSNGKKKKKRSKYSKDKDQEWLKEMKKTDAELVAAFKNRTWVEDVKANLKNKPEEIYIPKEDPKGDLDFAKNKVTEYAQAINDIIKEQVTRLHNVSGLVNIVKDGIKDDVQFKKDQLKTLLIPETPKERLVDFKTDVQDLLLGTKQDLIGEWQNTTEIIVDKTTKWVPVPTPMPSPPPFKLWKPDKKEAKETAKEDLKKLKKELDPKTIEKEIKEEVIDKKEDKLIEAEDKFKLPQGSLTDKLDKKAEKVQKAESIDPKKIEQEVVEDPVHTAP
eukprot:jgi/Botrbrau1/481/Bobra.110_2s0118.1